MDIAPLTPSLRNPLGRPSRRKPDRAGTLSFCFLAVGSKQTQILGKCELSGPALPIQPAAFSADQRRQQHCHPGWVLCYLPAVLQHQTFSYQNASSDVGKAWRNSSPLLSLVLTSNETLTAECTSTTSPVVLWDKGWDLLSKLGFKYAL